MWSPSEKRWIDGQRILADAGRNLIAEGGAKLKKIPRKRAQPIKGSEGILPGNTVSQNRREEQPGVNLREGREAPSSSKDEPQWGPPKKKYGLRSGWREEINVIESCDVLMHKVTTVFVQQVLEDTRREENGVDAWIESGGDENLTLMESNEVTIEELVGGGFDL